MYAKIRQLNSKRVLLIVLALTCGITAVTASAKYWKRSDPLPAPVVKTQAPQAPPRQTGKPAATLLPIQLKPLGWARAELSAPEGYVELLILNVSGNPGLTFHFERENEQDQKPEKLNTPRGKPMRKKLHLKSGVYRLSVVEHPEWVCRLIITE